ncbi:hypothetical protein ASZ90_014812 [hydrocarbon metagenome]|uniref:Uncharacterized protein n=1 Tax=hydrocarbon metagenome TaxID=938273 RepID=A0A0W8F3U2_9ZZZZ
MLTRQMPLSTGWTTGNRSRARQHQTPDISPERKPTEMKRGLYVYLR